jgi:hypothetical protein
VRYAFIRQERRNYPIRPLCRAMQVSVEPVARARIGVGRGRSAVHRGPRAVAVGVVAESQRLPRGDARTLEAREIIQQSARYRVERDLKVPSGMFGQKSKRDKYYPSFL